MKKNKLLLLSVLSGALLSLAWPAIGGLAPLLLIGLVPLLFVEEFIYKSERGSIFGYAFLSFLIWNALSTRWLYCVSEDFATKVLAVSVPVLVNSCLMAIIFTLFHFTKRKIGEKEGYISLVFYWLGFEYLHLNWELTWTWLTLGNGFANYTKWIQWYEYTGVFGGSLWILVTNITFFWLLREGLNNKKTIRENKRLIGILSSLIVIPILISQLIYDNYKEVYKPVKIVVVQPNIDPYGEKYGGLSYKEQLDKLLQLAVSATDSTTEYIIAPETALTENIWENEMEQTYSINAIRTFTRQYPSLKFVVGVSSYKMFMPGEELSNTARQFTNEKGWYDAYNTAMQI
ncbi:MAG: apolipoprotein N-acyltransferase, partial [Candidatus Anammoxibacter sp.]